MNHKSAKKSYQIVLFRPIKALAFQLLSTTKLVHTACVPRAPAAVLRAVGVVRGRHQTKTNQATVELCSTEPIVAYS